MRRLSQGPRTEIVRSQLILFRWQDGALMMMMMLRVLLLLSSGSVCRHLFPFCCLDDKGGEVVVCVGVGVLSVS